MSNMSIYLGLLLSRKHNLTLIYFAVVGHEYQSEISSEHVLLGNAVLFKCSIPSFVADFVEVEAWIDNEAMAYYRTDQYGNED